MHSLYAGFYTEIANYAPKCRLVDATAATVFVTMNAVFQGGVNPGTSFICDPYTTLAVATAAILKTNVPM